MHQDKIELLEVSAHTNKRQLRSPSNLAIEFDNELDLDNVDFDLSRSSNNGNPTPAWSGLGADSTWGSRVTLILKIIWQGPRETRDSSPRPIQSLLFFEELPRKLKRNLSTAQQLAIYAVYLVLWLLLWSKMLLPYLTEIPVDSNGAQVMSLTCGQTDVFWKGKNAACGLDAKDCQSLVTSKDVIFRCPALCDRGSWLYSLRAVGSEIIKYRGYIIGGGPKKKSDGIISYPYRADSYPCGAAVHLGLFSPVFGGCARASFSSGPQLRFKGARGRYSVSDSISFGSLFPFSYVFKLLSAAPSHCYDPRLMVLLTNIILGAPLVYFAPGVVFYWTLAVIGFWTIVSATDPPVVVDPQEAETFYQLISVGLERFLPTCFILYVLWVVSVKRTFTPESSPEHCRPSLEETLREGSFSNLQFSGDDSPLSRVFLWYPLFWLGVLNNITFDRLPVDRLTWHDLQVQRGALLTVAIVALLLLVCIVAQAYYVWLLGRFWKLLLVYAGIFGALFFLGVLPGLTLRVHHYIFGLVFIPGCSTRGRTAYAFQGILLGLFLSGVSRWGYASIAETNLSLLRGEPLGQLRTPEITGFKSGLLYWQSPHLKNSLHSVDMLFSEYAYVSLLVNDIERFRGKSNGTVDVGNLLEENKEFRLLLELGPRNTDTPIYLRLAKFLARKDKFGDYTRAAILKVPSFEFEAPPPGIT